MVGSRVDLLTSGNKPSTGPILIKISDTILCVFYDNKSPQLIESVIHCKSSIIFHICYTLLNPHIIER